MCKFFSLVSNGNGKALFFLPEDIVTIMAKGNKESYDFNSHTSLMHFKKINGAQEDKWNKWEYNPETKEIKLDTLAGLDDREEAKKHADAFFEGKDLGYLRNLFGRNSGDLNSGNRNSGDRNSGDRNSGDRNSGNRNSGYLNSGDRNSGDRNSGYLNSGDLNSGNRNSGDLNSGYLNSGDLNSGDLNSGDLNSGNRNSGYLNSNEPKVRMFNKDTKKTFAQISIPSFLWDICPTEWVEFSAMTDQEKIDHPKAYVCDGYLKVIGYKESWAKVWAKATEAEKQSVYALPNFSAKVFEEISGIKVNPKKKAKK
jgi:hypothetical protein